MRRYDIQILTPGSTSPMAEWKSYDSANKTNYPNAANVEWDIPVTAFAQPAGVAWVRIWGIPLKTIGSSSDFTWKNIRVYGGFSPLGALPLNKPKQYGLLFSGWIINSFGNWQGTDMTLDLYCAAGSAPSSGKDGGTGQINQPKNYSLSWNKGMTLETALTNVFHIALPHISKIDFRIDPSLVATDDWFDVFPTMESLNNFVNQKSKTIKGDTKYNGVQIYVINDTILVSDFTNIPSNNTKIDFSELIGQPTYGAPSGYEIQFKTPLRSDISVTDSVALPTTIYTTTNSAASGVLQQSGALDKNKSLFKGAFSVKGVRHVANFRSTDENAWITIFNAYLKP